jgi:hypothetical protein
VTDQPVTPDREALIEALRLNWSALPTWELGAAVDAILPLLTDALDRARQQGRDDVAQAISAIARHPSRGTALPGLTWIEVARKTRSPDLSIAMEHADRKGGR